jgi:RNA polymerase sigma-70 factor (ECF subfamily)
MSEPAIAIVLCERARSGDLAAASELVTLHYERIFAWFRRLCGHDADAADLTQKVFCKAWATLERYEGRSSFSTWLHGIGYHVYVDWLRQRKPTAQPEEHWWMNRTDSQPGPFEQTADKEMEERIYALVEQLDPDTRHTVHLHYYQGLSLAETAEVLGVAASTVKYRLREAVSFLKKRVESRPLSTL